MSKNKHIAMWTCRRSRSTVTTLAFEQLNECLIFDAPFYAPYLLYGNKDEPHKQEIINNFETDYQQIIAQITGDLPEGFRFSFQRHIAQETLPLFGRDWLKDLDSFFLIRHPKSIICSYQKVYERLGIDSDITMDDIAIDVLFNLFEEVRSITGKTPLVIDSADLAKHPRKVLQFLCAHFDVNFLEKMLTWDTGLKNSKLVPEHLPAVKKNWQEIWYNTINQSSQFLPYEENKQVNVPDQLIPLLEYCLPFYEKLHHYCPSFD
ncbi:MAG: hypothetical protein AAF383_11325 [Cyanobacteria bacterium P01_A01_bin.83]